MHGQCGATTSKYALSPVVAAYDLIWECGKKLIYLGLGTSVHKQGIYIACKTNNGKILP